MPSSVQPAASADQAECIRTALEALLHRSTLRDGRRPHLILWGPRSPVTGNPYYIQFASDRPSQLTVDLPGAAVGGNVEVWWWALDLAKMLRGAPGIEVGEDVLGEGVDSMPHLWITFDPGREGYLVVLVDLIETYFRKLGVQIEGVETEDLDEPS